jgi:hypothetical protein
MVEHRLPKPVVAGSIPVSRSRFSRDFYCADFSWNNRAAIPRFRLFGIAVRPALTGSRSLRRYC